MYKYAAMSREMLKMAWQMYSQYVGSSLHMVLLLIALLIIALDKGEEHKRLFLGYTIGFAIVFFCPVTAWAISKFVGDTYWRMLWALPTPVILAYAMTRCWNRAKKWRKGLLILLFAGTIALTGKSVYFSSDTPFEKAENVEKIPQTVVDIADLLRAHDSHNTIKVAAPEEITWYIRQYDGSFRQVYGRKTYFTKKISYIFNQLNTDDIEMNYKKLAKYLRKLSCKYVIVKEGEGRVEGMEAQGYAVIGQVDKYVIYEDMQEEEDS